MIRAARILVLALLPLGLAACEGPTGPEGPPGPPGAPGDGARLTFVGVLDDAGWGEILLPQEAGTMDDPPMLTCYIADDDWYWYVVNTDFENEIYCVIEEENGRLYAVLDAQILAGWRFALVVMY